MEGPSIHYLAQVLQIFINNKVSDAFGNAKFEKAELIGQKIKDIYPFGKRIIIQLEEYVLVTHFLMYGSYRIEEERADLAPRFALITKYHALYFYNCSTKCAKASSIKEDIPFERDILSPDWDLQETVRIIKKHPQETIDDILLDQEIFAGVGNIIKNEALALSKINPHTKVMQLSTKKITEVTQNTRNFSQDFLKFLKNWPQLKKQMLVYRRATCARCGTKIVRLKTGKRNRWSFFCPKCQKV